MGLGPVLQENIQKKNLGSETHKLGRVAASMNSMKQMVSSGTSSFETIDGMHYYNTDVCDQEELGKCMTLDQVLQLVACPS